MVRALVQRLPVMITPRWVSQPTQPLAIEDLIDYLLSALDVELDASTVIEIGGPDRVSYMDVSAWSSPVRLVVPNGPRAAVSAHYTSPGSGPVAWV